MLRQAPKTGKLLGSTAKVIMMITGFVQGLLALLVHYKVI